MKTAVTLSKIGEVFPSLTEGLLRDGYSVFGYFDITDYVPKNDPRHETYRSGLSDIIEVADTVYMTPSAASSQLGLYATCICEIDKEPINIIPEEIIQ